MLPWTDRSSTDLIHSFARVSRDEGRKEGRKVRTGRERMITLLAPFADSYIG